MPVVSVGSGSLMPSDKKKTASEGHSGTRKPLSYCIFLRPLCPQGTGRRALVKGTGLR